MTRIPIDPDDLPLVTPLNALAPGGYCRCNGHLTYGDTASCDAPPALLYTLKRSAPIHEEDFDLSDHNTYGLWDCWQNATLYLERIDAMNVPSYTDFEPWDPVKFPGPYGGWICDVPEMPGYQYAAYRSGSTEPLAVATITSNVIHNGAAYYKVLYLHLACNITWPSPSTCELSATPPVTRSCGAVLYVSAPFQTSYAAWMAHAPCLERVGTAYLFTDNQHVFGNSCDGEPCNIDQIDVVLDDDLVGVNMQDHNETMYGWIEQLSKFGDRKFCHCSELINGTYGYQSGGTWYGYPSSITVAVSGFTDHAFLGDYGYKSICKCAFLNGTYTLVPGYPGSNVYGPSSDLEVEIDTYWCNNGTEELLETLPSYPTVVSLSIHDCGHARTHCRSISGVASAGLQSCNFFWGDDWLACDPFGDRSQWVAPEPDPIPAGYDNATLCSSMIGSPARRGFFGQSGDVVVLSRSLNVTILSINP